MFVIITAIQFDSFYEDLGYTPLRAPPSAEDEEIDSENPSSHPVWARTTEHENDASIDSDPTKNRMEEYSVIVSPSETLAELPTTFNFVEANGFSAPNGSSVPSSSSSSSLLSETISIEPDGFKGFQEVGGISFGQVLGPDASTSSYTVATNGVQQQQPFSELATNDLSVEDSEKEDAESTENIKYVVSDLDPSTQSNATATVVVEDASDNEPSHSGIKEEVVVEEAPDKEQPNSTDNDAVETSGVSITTATVHDDDESQPTNEIENRRARIEEMRQRTMSSATATPRKDKVTPTATKWTNVQATNEDLKNIKEMTESFVRGIVKRITFDSD